MTRPYNAHTNWVQKQDNTFQEIMILTRSPCWFCSWGLFYHVLYQGSLFTSSSRPAAGIVLCPSSTGYKLPFVAPSWKIRNICHWDLAISAFSVSFSCGHCLTYPMSAQREHSPPPRRARANDQTLIQDGRISTEGPFSQLTVKISMLLLRKQQTCSWVRWTRANWASSARPVSADSDSPGAMIPFWKVQSWKGRCSIYLAVCAWLGSICRPLVWGRGASLRMSSETRRELMRAAA